VADPAIPGAPPQLAATASLSTSTVDDAQSIQ
jgi:hypothetical protein